MKVLVACEFSGAVRDAFITLGHDAWSCDLDESEGIFTERHLRCDVREVLSEPWDLMIAHPPCTHLCASGGRHGAARSEDSVQALAFVLTLWSAPIARIALENPIGILSSVWMKPDQIIQPWMFGHPETKATCLWLRRLPQLHPTIVLEERNDVCHYTPDRKSRSKDRSRTLPGVASAMADQWGD